MNNEPVTIEIQSLKARIAALEQLLEVSGKAAIEQSDKLYAEIAERKRAELALRQGEHFLNTLLNAIPVPVFYKDSEGRYLGFNKAYETYFGATRDQLIGKSVFDISPPELAKIYHAKDTDLYESSGIQQYESQVKDTHGSLHDVVFSKAVFTDNQGVVSGLIGVILDITERKLAEGKILQLNKSLNEKIRQLLDAQEELVRKEKLAILGQLSGSVGHELRNPLGVISNAVYFLKIVLSEADETTRDYLEIIKHEIDTSLQIITDLLDFARTKTPQTKCVTVRQLLEEILGKSVVPDNVNLQTDLPDRLPLLRIDPLQMGQVFQNLITNAFQAMPDGGSLCIAARLVDNAGRALRGSPVASDHTGSFLQETGDSIEISVTDTGEGVSPESMNKLFQPLFTTKPRGIGLGMVVCKNLTEANGGRIEVESQLGKGTTFSVILPCERG
ncbi:MAG: ATP-binding protein [Desulfuromonadaceae bacterium]|nr:ATP-binding protein [Desulfuromonadaceae bacterium]MDD5105229.1 ATP-binding protein [Desulfuromonadaceae bacterium]